MREADIGQYDLGTQLNARTNVLSGEADENIRNYLKAISRYPLLKAEDEVKLAQQIERGREATAQLEGMLVVNGVTRAAGYKPKWSDEQIEELQDHQRKGGQAGETFILSNLRLVVSVAKSKKYADKGLPFLDLIQEGNLGLFKAVDKFKWRRGFKFSTYATWWIRQGIERAIANTGRTIRVPVHQVDRLYTFLSAKNRLSQELEREPTDEELAAESGFSVAKIRDLQSIPADPDSLDRLLTDDGDITLNDLIGSESAEPSEETLERVAGQKAADDFLKPLDKLERDVVEARFGIGSGEPRSQEDVGREYGLTRDEIRHIEAEALNKMRQQDGAKELYEELGQARGQSKADLSRLRETYTPANNNGKAARRK